MKESELSGQAKARYINLAKKLGMTYPEFIAELESGKKWCIKCKKLEPIEYFIHPSSGVETVCCLEYVKNNKSCTFGYDNESFSQVKKLNKVRDLASALLDALTIHENEQLPRLLKELRIAVNDSRVNAVVE